MAVAIALIISAVLIAMDQITKHLAAAYLLPSESVKLIPYIINLTYVENTGAAFGIFKGGRWPFIVMTIIVITAIIVIYLKLPKSGYHNCLRAALILITSGAVGNFIDRIRNGYVVDFIETAFMDFPVFNVADSCLVIGTIFLGVLVVFEKRLKRDG